MISYFIDAFMEQENGRDLLFSAFLLTKKQDWKESFSAQKSLSRLEQKKLLAPKPQNPVMAEIQ